MASWQNLEKIKKIYKTKAKYKFLKLSDFSPLFQLLRKYTTSCAYILVQMIWSDLLHGRVKQKNRMSGKTRRHVECRHFTTLGRGA